MHAEGSGSFQCFCGGLDPSTTAQELHQLVSSVGPCSVDLRQGARRAGSNAGRTGPGPAAFAYIAFGAPEHVEEAVQQFNGHELHGSILRVLPRRPPSLPRPPRTRGKKQGQWPADGSRGDGGGGGGAPTRILLQGLAPDIGAQQLVEHGSEFGQVVSAAVDADESGASLGTGECVFALPWAAEEAADAWQGSCMLGGLVEARVISPPPPPQQPWQQHHQQPWQHHQQQHHQQQHHQQQQQRQPAKVKHGKHATKPAIVVRGLSRNTSADQLALAFSEAGPVRRLRLVTEEDGRSAGVAFIEFADPHAFQAALAMGDSLTLDGQQATVAPANRSPGPEQQLPQHQQQQLPPPSEGEEEGADGGGEEEEEQQLQQSPHQQPDGAGEHSGRDAHAPRQQHQPPLQRLRGGSLSPSSTSTSLRTGEVSQAGQLQLQHAGRAGPSRPMSSHGPGPPPPLDGDAAPDTLFIRPLGPDVNEAGLWQLFGIQASACSVKVLRHPDGTSKGCGFARFRDHSQALAALQSLNGALAWGRPLRLSWAIHRHPPHGSTSWEWSGMQQYTGRDYGGIGTPRSGWGYYQQPAPAHCGESPRVALSAKQGAGGGGDDSPLAVPMLPVMAAPSGYPGGPVMLSATTAAYYYHNGQLIAHAAGSMPAPLQLASPMASPGLAPPPYAAMPAAMSYPGPPVRQAAGGGGPAAWQPHQQQPRWQQHPQWRLQQQQHPTFAVAPDGSMVWLAGPQPADALHALSQQEDGSYPRRQHLQQQPQQQPGGVRQGRARAAGAATQGSTPTQHGGAQTGQHSSQKPPSQQQQARAAAGQAPQGGTRSTAVGLQGAPASSPGFFWDGAAAAGQPPTAVVHFHDSRTSSGSGSGSIAAGIAASSSAAAGAALHSSLAGVATAAAEAAAPADMAPAADSPLAAAPGERSPTPDVDSGDRIACSANQGSPVPSRQPSQQQLSAGGGSGSAGPASSQASPTGGPQQPAAGSPPADAAVAAEAAADAMQRLRMS